MTRAELSTIRGNEARLFAGAVLASATMLRCEIRQIDTGPLLEAFEAALRNRAIVERCNDPHSLSFT
jgi:hypothetical protein